MHSTECTKQKLGGLANKLLVCPPLLQQTKGRAATPHLGCSFASSPISLAQGLGGQVRDSEQLDRQTGLGAVLAHVPPAQGTATVPCV